MLLEAPTGRAAPVIIHAIYRSKLPASAFTNASDLSTAQTTASGPFMGGTLTYSSAMMTGPQQSTGSVTGAIVAHFDGLAPVTLPAPPSTQANLNVS